VNTPDQQPDSIDKPAAASAAKKPMVSSRRAWRHLLGSTPWMLFFSAAYAYSFFWAFGFVFEQMVDRATYFRVRDQLVQWPVLLTFWFAGVFAPSWFFFSLYGFWLRMAKDGKTLPGWVDRLLSITLLVMPWWWLMLLVRDPRVVLRGYKRRFLGEAQYFMDEQAHGNQPPTE
jgi:hypothetical protein